jgi:hypothetical protein
MIDAFDAQAVPLAGFWPAMATLAALAAVGLWRWSGRKAGWFVFVFIGVFGVFGVAVPSWDQIRLRHMLASGEGLTVTRGTITQTWHIVDRRRDYASSLKNAYKTVVSEGFDVGAERFSWVVGQCLSPSALCDLAVLKTPLVQGQQVEVTWFDDAAQQDRRVLRLRVEPLQPRPR